MISLDRIGVFLEVAQKHSFSQAARVLGLSGPAVSKQIAALEDELGVKLFQRTTRQVILTDEGQVFFERALTAMEELREATLHIQEARSTPRGTLRISIPMSFGHMHLLPAISSFAKQYPDVLLDISLEDRMVDVISERFDVVVRIGALQDSGLIVKPLAPCPIYVVASPEYVAQYGMPTTPNALKKHRMIMYARSGSSGEWRCRDKQGKITTIRTEGTMKANTAEMMLQAALDGVGITILPGFMVTTYLKAGKLQRILPTFETYPTRQMVALMPPNRYRSNKVMLFIQWLIQACAAIPQEHLPDIKMSDVWDDDLW
ncbi:MAG: LysR family transcriptional regulator [Rickettsiales bacterium]|nr:LysR family transcriptional regulator [Rickettsiales bacterium]